MMRGRRQERRDERQQNRAAFGRHGDAVRYQMRQKLVSIGDDFWIETDRAERAFKVDGKALRVRKTLVFEDQEGHELARIAERVARVRDTMEIEGPDGSSMATVRKAVISPLRERYSVKVRDGADLDVQGNIVDHEYRIFRDGQQLAEISKKWFRARDTYGVQIKPGQNDIIILAVTVAIDMISHD